MSRYKVVLAVLLVLVLSFSTVGYVEAADKTMMLKIGTGYPGGLWYPASAVLAAEVEKALRDIGYDATASIHPSGGAYNAPAVNEGKDMQLTFTTAQNQYLAYNGLDPYTEKMNNLRLIGTQEFMITQFVVPEDSDIHSVPDLKGKIVNVGRVGANDRVMMEALFKAYDMTFDDVGAAGGQIMALGWDDASAMMQDGHLDFIGTFGGLMPSIVNLIVQPGVRFLSLDEKNVEIMLKDPTMVGFVSSTLKAGTYDGQDYDVLTVAVPTTVMCNKDLPEDAVYAITKVIYESGYHTSIFASTEAKGWPKICNPEDLPKVANIPIHPGAAKYFKEIGIEIPEQ